MCGHLFCWPCIFEWIKNHTDRPCPVCKSAINKEKLIPLYGRGKEPKDPRMRQPIPERPPGQRTEAANQHPTGIFNGPFGNTVQFDNFTFTAGFGFFPSLFGLQFQGFPGAPGHNEPLTAEQMNSAFLSRVLLLLGIWVILCLLFF